jgi:hypothetical protein
MVAALVQLKAINQQAKVISNMLRKSQALHQVAASIHYIEGCFHVSFTMIFEGLLDPVTF